VATDKDRQLLAFLAAEDAFSRRKPRASVEGEGEEDEEGGGKEEEGGGPEGATALATEEE
jgi:hypothetical protein